MSNYRTISETEVAVDAPITQQLCVALRENPLAYREGDSTLGDEVISYKALSNGTPSAGNVIICQSVWHGTNSKNMALVGRARKKGTFRIKAELRIGAMASDFDGNILNSSAKIRIKKRVGENGPESILADYVTVTTSNNVSVTVDDLIELDELVYIEIESVSGVLEGTAVMTVGIDDTNAVYGVDFVTVLFDPIGGI